MKVYYVALAIATLLICPRAASAAPDLGKLRLPAGFRIQLFATGLDSARSLAIGPRGTIFVGSRDSDKVYGVRDTDNDGVADKQWTVLSGLDSPNGVDVHGTDLYVAEIGKITRYPDIENHLDDPGRPQVIRPDLPTERWHGPRYLRVGPDDKLYVAIGAPCNACVKDDKRFATIMRMNLDGSQAAVFALGVRDSLGFDWDPETREFWFTDNGRDRLGDDAPPDELNRAASEGLNFGFPYCHGRDIQDPEFKKSTGCTGFEPPMQELGAHVASLGMRFYTGKMFPDEYRGNIFIAEHGSWDRSSPVGYRVTRVRLSGGRPVAYTPFIEGWLEDRRPTGRPVDLLVLGDGSLLVSDDTADVIYRVSYGPH